MRHELPGFIGQWSQGEPRYGANVDERYVDLVSIENRLRAISQDYSS
jgi:hypothetical protein